MWPEPLAGIDHGRALAEGPVVSGRIPGRLEVSAAMPAGKCPDCNRKMRWAHDACAGLLHGAACQLGHDGVANDVAGLALVGRHPQRRVPLEMFNRAEAFAPCDFNIRDSDIVLLVHERFSAPAGHMPKRRDCNCFIL